MRTVVATSVVAAVAAVWLTGLVGFVGASEVSLFAETSPDALPVQPSKEKRRSAERGRDRSVKRSEPAPELRSMSREVAREAARALRAMEDAWRDRSLQGAVDLNLLFGPVLQDWEREGRKPWSDCHVLSRPALPGDVGLSAQIDENTIDMVGASLLREMAASNAPIQKWGDETAIRRYAQCLALYGVTIAQGFINLVADLDALTGRSTDVNRLPEAPRAILDRVVGFDDLAALARAALARAAVPGGIQQSQFARLLAGPSSGTCRFDGAVERLQCGDWHLTLQGLPELRVAGVEVYGKRYAGYQAEFHVSTGWSWGTALEALKGVKQVSAAASRVATEMAALREQGRVREAIELAMHAVANALAGKLDLMPNK